MLVLPQDVPKPHGEMVSLGCFRPWEVARGTTCGKRGIFAENAYYSSWDPEVTVLREFTLRSLVLLHGGVAGGDRR